jgi:hypothetical protein
MKKENKPRNAKGRPILIKEKEPPKKLVNFRVSLADKELMERLADAGRLSLAGLIRGMLRMERSRVEEIQDRIKEKRNELKDLFKLENAERERLQSLELGISEEE